MGAEEALRRLHELGFDDLVELHRGLWEQLELVRDVIKRRRRHLKERESAEEILAGGPTEGGACPAS